MNNLREKLAAYAHEAWAGGRKSMFSKCAELLDRDGDILLKMPRALYNRWQFQMNTSYADLPEDMKPSDRDEADKMIAIFEPLLRQQDELLTRLDSAGQRITELTQNHTDRHIVCLCGSTRFKLEYNAANLIETTKGHIVLSVGCYAHGDGIKISDAQKALLDSLHLDKIRLADEILVIDPDGYIGESTANEIAFAISIDKPVRYWSSEQAGGYQAALNILQGIQ